MRDMKYRGQTLLALMLSLSLSSLLLLVVLAFYGHVQRQNHDILRKLQLQTELQRVLQTMGRDIRRAGFRALSEGLTQNNLGLFELDETGTAFTIGQSPHAPLNSCILFFYDVNANGCIGSKNKGKSCITDGKNSASEISTELFGYRLNDDMLESRQTYKNSINQNCKPQECQSYIQPVSCDSSGWTDLLDDKIYRITALEFNLIGQGPGIQIYLAGQFVNYPQIQYETGIVIPLMNQGEWR
ncbi:hypothetical protein CBG46_07145 [Actinobacillus succinogenes]|uniref:Type II secretory pathway component PulJ n=1 Tax=Actinobacillus succinogenes (strain ATCC 55618 / DSM 22257 / CCUG 43843 / 130Z) TaxID=339671 RepID=A6VQ93_ACTSZ|nr:type II secretion system protein J [Actinobacillus succinogenes]ABR75140.1 conserved hypothetical protein [Actinobacillus succinogenes 130Z]PHI40463.1 hypothetical protein CBG46_07145 [Actinobacillus succinogenes]